MIKHTMTAPNADYKSISHLFNNLDLIITHRDEILSQEQYRNIYIPGMYVAGLHVGKLNLSLGDMLNLWQKTEWKNGAIYYFSIIGSPLTGVNNAHWYNVNTRQFESGAYYGFLGLARPALAFFRQTEPERSKISPSSVSVFDLVHQLQQAR